MEGIVGGDRKAKEGGGGEGGGGRGGESGGGEDRREGRETKGLGVEKKGV